MAAQQHIEQRGAMPMLPIEIGPLPTEHIDEKLQGYTGTKKTNILVSELKKHYKLNMLKSYID